jgi:glucose-6-phosphate isomerase
MINLEKVSGLPILFNPKNNNITSNYIAIPKADTRTLSQMKPVLEGKTQLKKFYCMYRNVASNPVFRKFSYRYDITVIPFHKIGKEDIKTAGHYHSKPRHSHLSFPEVYQVLHGTAHYLLQKKEGKKIKDVILAVAKEGQVVIVPPNYGHVTINAGRETLVMANLVYGRFSSKYGDYIKKHGAAYYGIAGKKIRFVKNPNYRNLPKLRNAKLKSKNLKSPIYADCIKNPEKYIFLKKPNKLFL